MMICNAAMPFHGSLPVSISHSTTPKAYWSTRSVIPPPPKSSGAMYAEVPAPTFFVVRKSPGLCLAMPKSVSAACPSRESKMFCGFCGWQVAHEYGESKQ